jgi:hypothetical protein
MLARPGPATQTKLRRYEPAWLAVASARSGRGGLLQRLLAGSGSVAAALRGLFGQVMKFVTGGRF